MGPVSGRDLDVLYRTSAINSSTLVWKDGMSEWKQLFLVEELKKMFEEEEAEMQQIEELYDKQQAMLAASAAAKAGKSKKQVKVEEKKDGKLSKVEELAK